MSPKTKARLGVIGGGQLALYLTDAASKLGFDTVLICNSKIEPATRKAKQVYIGSPSEVFKKHTSELSDVVWTFENEFLDIAGLETIRCLPNLAVLDTLRNKRRQKQLLDRLKIPTAAYEIFDKIITVGEYLQTIEKRFGNNGWVLKWAEGGYDGRGTFIASSHRSPKEATDFLARSLDVFAEEKIDFKFECALVACRDSHSKIIHYPLVWTEQDNGICRNVKGSALALKLTTPEMELQAQKVASQILEDLNYVGCLGVEFFVDEKRGLLVNEIAPRVHNTAHYSMDASNHSQFENHVRAVLDLGIESPKQSPLFAMKNILGPKGLQAYDRQKDAGDVPAPPLRELAMHWYGKSQMAEGRKLGHVNLVCNDPSQFETLCQELERFVFEIEKKIADKSF